MEEKRNNEKANKKNNSVINKIGLFLILAVVFGLSFYTSTFHESYAKDDFITEIEGSEYFDLLNSEEKNIIMLSRPTCPHCQSFKPKISKFSSDYEQTIYYINTSKIKGTDLAYQIYLTIPSLVENETEGLATPTTVITQNGKVIDTIDGDVDYSEIVKIVKRNGIID